MLTKRYAIAELVNGFGGSQTVKAPYKLHFLSDHASMEEAESKLLKIAYGKVVYTIIPIYKQAIISKD